MTLNDHPFPAWRLIKSALAAILILTALIGSLHLVEPLNNAICEMRMK